MKLDDLHKKNIYKVPEGYFDELPGRIQQRIQSEKSSSKLIQLPWPSLVKYALPVAASIAILVAIFVNQGTENPTTISYQEMLNEISTEEMLTFLELEDITSYEIIQSVNVESLEEGFENLNNDYLELDDAMDEATLDAIMDEYDIDFEDI